MKRLLPSACGLLLASCAATAGTGMERAPVKDLGSPPSSTNADLWAQLRSGAPEAPKPEGADAAYLGMPGVPLRMLACLLPLEIATDRAWKLTDETILPPESRALWHANGLRLGLLPEAKWEDFRRALNKSEKNAKTNPGVLAQEASTIVLRAFPEAMRKGGPMPGRSLLPLDTTLPPFAPSVTSLTAFEGDHVQLLATGVFSAKSFIGLRLTPHIHHPRSVLEENLRTLDSEGRPRALKPWEKEIQGQSIEALATPELRPSKGQVLVIGLWWPWRKSDAKIALEGTPAPSASGKQQAPKTPPKDGKKPDDPDDLHLMTTAPPLAATLGRALFTTRRGEGECQVIVVIGTR